MPGHIPNDKFHQPAHSNSSKRISPLFPGFYSIQKNDRFDNIRRQGKKMNVNSISVLDFIRFYFFCLSVGRDVRISIS